MTPTLTASVANRLGIAGFALACASLLWQTTTWYLATRVRLKVRPFRAKWSESVVVAECENASFSRSVQVRMVWIQWGKDKKRDGIELPPELWQPTDGRVPPGTIFQAKVDLASMHAQSTMPEVPVTAWAVVRIGARKRSVRGRRATLK